jgi:hypothetical protein
MTVTAMTFRAWNRGLAVVEGENKDNPYGVWTFDGQSWSPNLTFPGAERCPGLKGVWAGEDDYWVFGGQVAADGHTWPVLCRYDGYGAGEWQEFQMPAATMEHVTKHTVERTGPADTELTEHAVIKEGELTSGACYAWNDCWFFGTYGVVVHWDGHSLSDDSPSPSQPWLQGEYTDAVARTGPTGSPFGVAVAATSEFRNGLQETELLPSQPGGAPPPEMFGSEAGPFSPLGLVPPTTAQAMDPNSGWVDPYRTDLVAVDFDGEGQGWVAGNPAGLRVAEESPPYKRPFEGTEAPQPSPLLPVSAAGQLRCAGPAEGRFAYSPNGAQTAQEPTADEGGFLWSSLAVIPGTGEALAGGLIVPQGREGRGPNEDGARQPVIVRVACGGEAATTRFRVEDTTARDYDAPGDRDGYVTAIAANAFNDAWAATHSGLLQERNVNTGTLETRVQPPRLYRLTNGEEPDAPAGNDDETRPLELQEEPPIYVQEPPQAVSQPAPTVSTVSKRVKLRAAMYDVRAKLHHDGQAFCLYLTFRLRRPVKVGAEGLRGGRVVTRARAHRFAGRSGVLVLKLNRKRWPTRVRFDS